MDYIEALLQLVEEAQRQGFDVIPVAAISPEGEVHPAGVVFTRGAHTVAVLAPPHDYREWLDLVLALIAAGLEWPPLPERN